MATQNQPSHCRVAGVALLYRKEAIGAAATLHSIKKVSSASLWRQNLQLVVWFDSSSLLFFLSCRVLYAIQWHSGDSTQNTHHEGSNQPSPLVSWISRVPYRTSRSLSPSQFLLLNSKKHDEQAPRTYIPSVLACGA